MIGGEAETPLLALVDALERGDAGPLAAVGRPGQPAAPNLKRLDFPVPSRAGLPSIKSYTHVERDGRMDLVAYTESSRGCLHRCRHCPIPPVYGGRFFVVPREVVLADIRQQIEAGARHVTFGDPDFLNGPTHALAVARALHAELPDVTFDVTAKIEHLLRHRAHLPALAAAGCLFIVSAAESLSDTVLAHLEKGHTRADILTALAATREAGITLRPTWVAFTPWTTLDDHRAWLDFLDAEGLIDHVDPVQYGLRLLVPPGSLLLETEALRPHLGPLEQADALLSVDPSRPAHGSAPGRDRGAGGPRGGDEGRRARHLRPRARDGGGGGRRARAGAGGPRHGQGPQAPAAPHRGVVLLSGAHQGPVGPDDTESPLAPLLESRRDFTQYRDRADGARDAAPGASSNRL